jgi:DNA-binding response OmpR family regulator
LTLGPVSLLQSAMENPNNGSRMRILVVDDEPAILRFVRLSLTAQGFDVIVAKSGEECLLLVASERPDLMVLDMVMPGVDGFTVLERLRDADGLSGASPLPVIACSAHVTAATRALSLGAADFISKPFLPGEMADCIRATISRRTTSD